VAWEGLGQPYPLAYSLLRGAGAVAAAGDRDGAASRLHRAAGLAGRLAAQPLQQQISQLARARIELASPADSPDRSGQVVPCGLTPRELEVLRLVAAGRGNRDIAAELFISRRTASVHVSNIRAMAGVRRRTSSSARPDPASPQRRYEMAE
jgi:DNA-binding CsgD family transcriptional regulator